MGLAVGDPLGPNGSSPGARIRGTSGAPLAGAVRGRGIGYWRRARKHRIGSSMEDCKGRRAGGQAAAAGGGWNNRHASGVALVGKCVCQALPAAIIPAGKRLDDTQSAHLTAKEETGMNRRDLFTWLWTLLTGLFVAGCPGRQREA